MTTQEDIDVGHIESVRSDVCGTAGASDSTTTGLIVTLGAMCAVIPLAVDMYLPALPRIAQDLGAPISKAQMTLPVFLAGLATGQLIWGSLSDRVGRVRPLLVGCVLFAVTSVGCAWCRTVESLVLARFLMGLAGSVGLVISRAVVRDLFDEHGSARMFSMMMIVSGIAPIVAPSIGGLVLKYADWSLIFWMLGGFGLLCAVSIRIHVPETLSHDRRVGGHLFDLLRQYGRLLVDPRFIGYAGSMGLVSGSLFAYLAGSSFVFMELFGLSAQRYGLLCACNGIAIYIVGRLNSLLLRRMRARQILFTASFVTAAAGLVLLAIACSGIGGVRLFFPVLLVCIASLGMQFPNATAVAMVPFAEQAGTASALLGMLGYIVGAGSGTLVGVLHNGTAVPMAAMVAACSVCAWLVLVWTRLREGTASR
jgi:DHA1 family bicyclomycin/chloramphenicol resistance-like MFS transporter